MRLITLGVGVGMIAGATVATMAIGAMYPDVPRRMLRDGKRVMRCTRRTVRKLGM